MIADVSNRIIPRRDSHVSGERQFYNALTFSACRHLENRARPFPHYMCSSRRTNCLRPLQPCGILGDIAITLGVSVMEMFNNLYKLFLILRHVPCGRGLAQTSQ